MNAAVCERLSATVMFSVIRRLAVVVIALCLLIVCREVYLLHQNRKLVSCNQTTSIFFDDDRTVFSRPYIKEKKVV